MAKYEHLASSHFFVPFAVETSGVLGDAAEEFAGELGRRLCKTTGEPRSREYLLQRISIAMQRGNAAAVLGTMGKPQLDSDFCMLIQLHDYVIFFLPMLQYHNSLHYIQFTMNVLQLKDAYKIDTETTYGS